MKNKILLFLFLLVLGNRAMAQVSITPDSFACGVDSVVLHGSLIGDAPTSASITADDGYGGIVPIGFSFNFYGSTYTQCVIGSNGMITFNTSLAGAYDPWPISSALLGNSSAYNTVCTPWCDMYIPDGGTITYSTLGTAPNRKFVVTWCTVAMFSCWTQWNTSQAILYETSNRVEVHCGHHTGTTCTGWNGGYAIIGVQNSTGTAATVAPGRDCCVAWTTTDEAWRFIPSGTFASYSVSPIPYAPVPYASSSIYWYDSTTGAYLGSFPTLHDTATVNTTFIAAAVGCGDTSRAYYHFNVSSTGGGSSGANLHITAIVPTNPSVCGLCDGSVKLTGINPHQIDTIFYAVGGVPQTIIVDSAMDDSVIIVHNLCAGVYNYFYVKVGHCISNSVATTLTNPSFDISSVTNTPPSVCGACDGTITINGLVPGYTDTIHYTYNGVPHAPVYIFVGASGSVTLNGMCAGSYTAITVKMNSCISSPFATTITNPGFAISSLSNTSPSVCGACDATLTIHGLVPGHSDTIHYTLGGVAQPPVVQVVSAAGTITLTGLCAGVYAAITATMNTCVTAPAGPVTITNPPFGISSTSRTDASCSACDGTITLNGLTPGQTITVNYNFNGTPHAPVVEYSNSLGIVVITNLCPGAYSNITATLNTCVSTPVGPITVLAPPLIPISVLNFANPSACGQCDGHITIHGVTPGMVDTIWYTVNGIAQTPAIMVAGPDSNVTFYNLCAASYNNFYIKCGPCPTTTITTPVNLVDPAIVPGFTTTFHYGCHGDTVCFNNGSHTPGPLWYAWDFGDGSSDTTTNPCHVYPTNGNYTIQLTATNHHCSQIHDTVITIGHPIHAAFYTTTHTFCQNSPVDFIDTSVGIPPTFLWHFGDGSTSTLASPSHPYLHPGQYSVSLIATNFVPCSDTAYGYVVIDSLGPVHMDISDTTFCRGTYGTFTGNYTMIGNTGITWNFGNGDSILNVNPVMYAYPAAGTYTVTATAWYRVCQSEQVSRVITVFPTPYIDLGPDTTICEGSTGLYFRDDINNINPLAHWHWNTGDNGPGIQVSHSGHYHCTVTVDGCSATDSVNVDNDCYVSTPNVFTPNGDGINDYFYPRSLLTRGLTAFSMNIYNRWGQEVFHSESVDGRGWDGSLNNTPQPEGVYIYIIDATFKDGVKEHHQGNITLIR